MLTISDIKSLLQQRKLSAVELVEDILGKLENNPYGATLCVNKHASLAEAKIAQKILDSGQDQALLGVPIMHKDVLVTKNWNTTAGSKILKNYKSPFDAEVVKKLFEKGTICIGKTSCDEFGMGSANQNCAYGKCFNPWDTRAIPGGSSGGSAAIVASGIVPAATGTDTGGSIRQPASMCGVTRIKPTYGRVSRWGLIAYASSLDQAGPIARTAQDCALLLDAMVGFDEKDSTSLNIPEENFSNDLDQPFEGASSSKPLSGIRIGVPEEYFAEGLDNDVAISVNNGIKSLEKLGATIKKISLPLSLFKFSLIDFLFLPVISSLGGGPGISVSNLSILITSAPKSARSMPASGPGPIPETSIILYPVNGPIELKFRCFFN